MAALRTGQIIRTSGAHHQRHREDEDVGRSARCSRHSRLVSAARADCLVLVVVRSRPVRAAEGIPGLVERPHADDRSHNDDEQPDDWSVHALSMAHASRPCAGSGSWAAGDISPRPNSQIGWALDASTRLTLRAFEFAVAPTCPCQCASCRFRTATPTMIIAIPATLARSRRSWRNSTPMTAMPAVPRPDQIA